ncbi:MAG: hypothetical protein HQK54_18325 [Oligoflexales bacterium]|nr:hypothetical protein [Oligoflexales bacterium]
MVFIRQKGRFLWTLVLLAALTGCEKKILNLASTKAEADSGGNVNHPLSDIISDIKTENISSIDPMVPESVKDAINAEGGKGYYATFVDPKDMIKQYEGLATDLKNIPAEELKNVEVKNLRDGVLKNVENALSELYNQTNPVVKFYAPFFSFSYKAGAKNVTNMSIGAYIVHMNLGIQTVVIDPNLIPMRDLGEANNFFGKSLIWCRNQACKAGNWFKGKTNVVGLTGGISVGNDLLAKGNIALTWKKGQDALGNLTPGKFHVAMGGSAVAGLASYTGYVEFDKGRPKLVLPAGMNLNVDTTDIFNRAFDTIVASSLGAEAPIEANPLAIKRGYYFGVKNDGSLGVVPVTDTFAPDAPQGFLNKELGVKAMGKKPNGDLDMKILANNVDCG